MTNKNGSTTRGTSHQNSGNTSANRNTGSHARGFAGMNAEKQRDIASQGGRAAYEKGVTHEREWNERDSNGDSRAHDRDIRSTSEKSGVRSPSESSEGNRRDSSSEERKNKKNE